MRRNRLVHVWLALAAVLLVGCAIPSGGPRPSIEPEVRADPWRAPSWLGGVQLREGDIILTMTSDFVSTLYTLHVPNGRYTHAMLLLSDGDGRPAALQMHRKGVELLPLHEHLGRYAQVTVLRRRNGDDEARKRLTTAARTWMERGQREKFVFALDGHGADKGPLTMNCVGLLNRIHDGAGLAEPFTVRIPRSEDVWADAMRRLINPSLPTMPMPDDALAHPDYLTVATGWNSAVDRRSAAVREETAAAIRQFVLAGCYPRPPRTGERLLIGATQVFNFTGFSREAREVEATILDFARNVENPLLDHIRRHSDITEETVRRLARQRCGDLREEYFRATEARVQDCCADACE